MRRMRKSVVFIFIFLFTVFYLQAQYVNSDSLMVVPGFEEPVTLFALDSMRYDLPESVIISGQSFFYGQHIPSGQLLSQFTLPSNGKVISRFGPRSGRIHTGTDIKMNRGDTVFASFYGVVTRAKYYYGYGNMVVIEHGNNLETSYAHLSEFLVKVGETVVKGQPVGFAGNTGRASTNHLHFEIREGNKPFDPELVFDFENGQVRLAVKEAYNLTELHNTLKPSGYSANEAVPQNYTVRNGDSLWKISRRFRTPVNTLCLLNGLYENSVLQVGMVLKLY
jgi:murein DD-endopeptidase MepM/ murein hydrolase activator NlpD